MEAGSVLPFQAIQRHLSQRRGLDLSRYKESYLRRRLMVRVRALRLRGLEEYARYLHRHPEEIEPLLAALSIKVTSFFRNRSCYAFLREKVVPSLIAEARSNRGLVTAWSAGCATGEEPYSIAALFAAEAGDRRDVTVRVLATDIDSEALATAERALFPADAILDVTPTDAVSQFEACDDGMVTPGDAIRRMVTFRRESLLDPFDRDALDLIVCRNVLIYFSLEHQKILLARFADSTRPGGYLVLGRVERLLGEARNLYEVSSTRNRIYRRPQEQGSPSVEAPCA
jgi:chemotaxis methyl-accepting protein methylase